MKIIRIEIECALPPDYTGVWWKNNLESDIEERRENRDTKGLYRN